MENLHQSFTNFFKLGLIVGLVFILNTLIAQPSGQRLKSLAPSSMYIGGTLGKDNFTNNSCLDIAKSEFNILTMDNDMKPYGLQPTQGTYTWGNADQFVDFCRDNNIAVHGHTLLYPAFGPDWLNGLTGSAMVNAVNAHIDAVVGRYKGKVAIWDVVNEATWYNWSNNTAGVWKDGPFQNYYDAFGDDFLADVFNRAHAADPDAILIYNDNVQDPYNDNACKAVLEVLRSIKNNGGYINGVGLQCHYKMSRKPDIDRLGYYIDEYKALGLDVYFTEIDVDMEGGTDYEGQANVYKDLMNLALSKGVKGFQTWGVYDGYSWLNDLTWGTGPNSNPLLFDDNYQPKAAYYAVQKALNDYKNASSSTIAFSGDYKILAKHSNKALDVKERSNEDGADTHQWDYVGGENQKWTITSVGDGYYKIVSKQSEKALDVDGGPGATNNGITVQQWAYVGADNQKWRIESVGNGYYKIIAKHSNKALDVDGGTGATQNGARVQQWEYVGGDNQKWRLESISSSNRLSREQVPGVVETVNLATPNPARHQANFHYKSNQAGNIRICIKNALGQVVLDKAYEVRTGENNIELDVSRFSTAGLHLIQVSGPMGAEKPVKLIVAR